MSDHPRDPVERLLELAGPRRAPARDRLRPRAPGGARGVAGRGPARQTHACRSRGGGVAGRGGRPGAGRRGVAPDVAPPAVSPAAPPSDVIVGTHNGTPVRLGSVLQTGPATRTALHLANGIEVRLDVNSEIAFDEASAISLARGGVFIDTGSAAGPNRSIDVRTSARNRTRHRDEIRSAADLIFRLKPEPRWRCAHELRLQRKTCACASATASFA